jgi:hypothetical protein
MEACYSNEDLLVDDSAMELIEGMSDGLLPLDSIIRSTGKLAHRWVQLLLIVYSLSSPYLQLNCPLCKYGVSESWMALMCGDMSEKEGTTTRSRLYVGCWHRCALKTALKPQQ